MLTKAILILILSLIPFAAHAELHRSDLVEEWVKKDGSLDSQAIARMLQVFREDAESNALIEQFAAKLGVAKPEDVFLIVRLAESTGDATADTVRGKLQDFRFYFDPDSPADERVRAQLKESAPNIISHRIRETPLSLELQTLAAPCIRLPKGDPLIESYAYFVHELKHAIEMLEPEDELDVTQFGSIEELVQAQLLKKGGELEAYQTGIAAQIRATKKYKVPFQVSRSEFFDKSGKLINPEGLKKNILDGSLYGSGYRGELARSARRMAHVQHLLHRIDRDRIESIRFSTQEKIRALEGANDPASTEKLKFYRQYLEKIGPEIESLTKKINFIESHYPER